MRIDLKPAADLDDDERARLEALTAAVYPPEVVATSPGRHLKWAPPEWSLLVYDASGDLVSHVGIVVRAGSRDGAAARIGGIGSVKTHPRAQGRGFASAGLRHAAAVLHEVHQVDFSMLVCQAHLLPFYERLGWLPFAGRLVVEQPGGPVAFTVNRPMVLAGHAAAPDGGNVDLQGLPW
jgi:GNAT superfamily N-acetyltransferase